MSGDPEIWLGWRQELKITLLFMLPIFGPLWITAICALLLDLR